MSDGKTVVTLGTATPGGGFPVYGQAVADTINEVDASLDVRTQNTKGIRRIQAKHAFLKMMMVPANSYPGQTADLVSVGSWSFIMTRRDLPDEIAYRLARALHRGEAALAAPRHDLIHPGARRHLGELGLLRAS